MSLKNRIIEALPRRIKSALVDLISLALASAISSIVEEELASTPQEIKQNAIYSTIILFSFFLNKDIYFGKSIGKYFIGLRVVRTITNFTLSVLPWCIGLICLLGESI